MQVLPCTSPQCSMHNSEQCKAAYNSVFWMVGRCISCNRVGFAQATVDAANMHRAGLGQLSRLRKLQHLSLAGGFASCTHNGMSAALATMTGIAPFSSERGRCHSCLCSTCLRLVHCEPLSLHSAHQNGAPKFCGSFSNLVQIWKR